MSRRIAWTCEECRQPIADGAGYLCLDLDAVQRYRRDARAWEERIRSRSPGGFLMYAVGDLLDLPARVPWCVLHRDCDPDLESNVYWFGVERIRDAAAALEWAAHLGGKSWIHTTTWTDVLHDCARRVEGQGRKAA